MKLVVLMILAAVAMGRPPPCVDYCRTMWYTTQLPPPWDPLCDCATRKIPVEMYNGRPVYTATTIFKMDDTGIYFHPSKVNEGDTDPLTKQPFYVANSLEEFLTKPPINVNYKALDAIHFRQHTPDSITLKYKSRNGAVLSDSNSYKSHSYPYRKEEMTKTNNDFKKTDKGGGEDPHQMGKSFSKCVDLYLVAVTRMYNNGSELAKIWGKSKYLKFSKLTDEDLMLTMEQECDESQEFLKKSVQEIIAKQAKKKLASTNNETTKTKQKKAYLEPNYKAGGAGPSNDGGVDNLRASELLDSEGKNPFPVPPMDTSDATLLSEASGITTTPTQDATKLDTKMATPIPEPFETLAPNNYNMDTPSMKKNKNKTEKYLVNKFSPYNNMHDAISPQWVPLYELTTAIEDEDANRKISNRAVESYPNLTTASQNKKGIVTATITYRKNRQINENEVAPQRLITREYAEGMINSVINGTEDLQSDDSTDEEEDDTENPLYASMTGGPGATEQVAADDQEKPVYVGNLYFRLGESYIPAKFIQKSDGKVHVAVDGATICAKVNEEEHDNEPPGLSGFCEKFPNKQDN